MVNTEVALNSFAVLQTRDSRPYSKPHVPPLDNEVPNRIKRQKEF